MVVGFIVYTIARGARDIKNIIRGAQKVDLPPERDQSGGIIAVTPAPAPAAIAVGDSIYIPPVDTTDIVNAQHSGGASMILDAIASSNVAASSAAADPLAADPLVQQVAQQQLDYNAQHANGANGVVNGNSNLAMSSVDSSILAAPAYTETTILDGGRGSAINGSDGSSLVAAQPSAGSANGARAQPQPIAAAAVLGTLTPAQISALTAVQSIAGSSLYAASAPYAPAGVVADSKLTYIPPALVSGKVVYEGSFPPAVDEGGFALNKTLFLVPEYADDIKCNFATGHIGLLARVGSTAERLFKKGALLNAQWRWVHPRYCVAPRSARPAGAYALTPAPAAASDIGFLYDKATIDASPFVAGGGWSDQLQWAHAKLVPAAQATHTIAYRYNKTPLHAVILHENTAVPPFFTRDQYNTHWVWTDAYIDDLRRDMTQFDV